MSCDMDKTGYPHNKVPSPQGLGPPSDALAAVEASLTAESGLGEATRPPTTLEHPFAGDGDQTPCLSRNLSNSCSSNADDRLECEAFSDTLPSEVSPANLGEGFGPSLAMILSSHATNTAANASDGSRAKHMPNPCLTELESPWGADSPWGVYKIPEAFNAQGRMTRWTEVIVQKVKPYVEDGRSGQHGGSGILDTNDPTHYYLMMPLGSLDLPPEVPEEIQEQRRMYSEATRIDPLGPDDHTGMTDNESSESSGDESSNDESSNDESSNDDEAGSTQGNDLSTEPFEAAIVPTVPTFGGLWNPIGTRDVRESRYSPDVISHFVFTDYETGSVMSWPSDERDPEDADAPARSVSHNSEISRNTDVVDVPAHESTHRSEGDSDPAIEELQAHRFFTDVQDEQQVEVEEMRANNIRHRIFVATTDGGTVRIDLPRVIVISYPGKPLKELAFSIANLSDTCWEIIKDHGIAGVRAITADKSTDFAPDAWTVVRQRRSGLWFEDNTRSVPVFDSAWIQANATFAMNDAFPFVEYYLDIQNTCDQSPDALAPEHISFLYHHLSDLPAHYLLNKPLAPPNGTLEEQMADGTIVFADENNLTVPQFIKRLYTDAKLEHEQNRLLAASQVDPSALMVSISSPPIREAAAMVDDWPVAERVLVPKTFDHDTAYFDLQQLNWLANVGYHPSYARQKRDERFVEYRNTDNPITHSDPTLDESYNLAHFVPKAMYTQYKASTPHKQLRNLMACKGYNAVVYASDRGADRSKVFHYHPFHDVRDCIIDLSKTSNETVYAEPVRISTLALSTGDYYRGICMVGGFDGEYALRNMLHDADDRSVIVGHATRASYGIINHIDIDYFAHGNEYRAVMACNDNKVRILDVATNTFLSDPGSGAVPAVRSGELSGHAYPWPVNCTAMCPYGKLRVVVGDTTDVSIVNAESGHCERILKGHEDYGFACAWSPDGYYIATANQDRLVKIWDTRSWRVVTEFAAQVAGYRSMRWSPVGGGSKCLLLAEPADRVCIVNATTYETMQTHEFYGEIVGMDFHGDGTGFWVANGDEKFGGMMEYERRGYGQEFGLGFLSQAAIEASGGVYREQGPNEWVWERERGDDPRVVDPVRTGPAGNWVENGLE